MTDDEMLDLAATVSGVEGLRRDKKYCNTYTVGDKYDCCFRLGWDPLGDDGDAMRLAMRLELDVLHRVVGGRRVEVLPPGGPLTQEFYEGNADSATRRAIVRAAAELGRRRSK